MSHNNHIDTESDVLERSVELGVDTLPDQPKDSIERAEGASKNPSFSYPDDGGDIEWNRVPEGVASGESPEKIDDSKLVENLNKELSELIAKASTETQASKS